VSGIVVWERDGHDDVDAAGAGGHDDDPRGKVDGLDDVVGDHHHRPQRVVGIREEAADLVSEGLRGQNVQRAERLVHREHLGLGDQGARDPDALLHAAGKLARVRVFVRSQADGLKDLLQAGLLLGLRKVAHRQEHIAPHGQPRKKGEVLKHHRDAG
jgi:hypothetical protein